MRDKIPFWIVWTVFVLSTRFVHAADPVSTGLSTATAEEHPLQITLVGADADPGDKLRYFIKAAPRKGKLDSLKPAQRTVTYTPNKDATGPDTFTFYVKDRAGHTSNVATVWVSIADVNDAPTAKPLTAQTAAGQPTTIKLGGEDPEGDRLTYTIVKTPENGAAAIEGDKIVFTPNPGGSGTAKITYRAFDGKNYSPETTAEIKVTPAEPQATAVLEEEHVEQLP